VREQPIPGEQTTHRATRGTAEGNYLEPAVDIVVPQDPLQGSGGIRGLAAATLTGDSDLDLGIPLRHAILSVPLGGGLAAESGRNTTAC
jgi:hypothetical protein